jgi:hypothetical protein
VTLEGEAAGGLVHPNGVWGETGEPLISALTVEALAEGVLGVGDDGRGAGLRQLAWLRSQPQAGLPPGSDPASLAEMGWGIVFAEDTPDAVREALRPLIERRRTQAGGLLRDGLVYRGQPRERWLADHGAAPGSLEPERVPFYLLLVGSPRQIPYGFSQSLAAEYAVGRLDFDTAGEYARYASGVLAYETGERVQAGREVAFFGTRHDPATELSADYLVGPLFDGASGAAGRNASPAAAHGFRSRARIGADATRAALADLLAAPGVPPSILFSATHGVAFREEQREAQRRFQGALLCQDAPSTAVGRRYFAAEDVPANARVHGMIAFNFACYSAGTPELDRFAFGQSPRRISHAPFTAALPRALLSHPNGAALACIGHVDRAWGCSIRPHVTPFERTLKALMMGLPVGLAVRDFGDRFLQASVEVARLVEESRAFDVDPGVLARQFVKRNDAEGYAILGDPAVRLRVADLA